jgi:chemotaxis-related protein WspB
MLLMVFHIGKERFALDSTDVLEIVPMVEFEKVPKAPDFLSGLFHYRGEIVPVIDLSCLAGQGKARRLLSTRIILVRYRGAGEPARILGLLAERMTDTVKAEPSDLTRAVVRIQDAPYLGDVIRDAEGMILRISLNDLLPPSVREMLFASGEN